MSKTYLSGGMTNYEDENYPFFNKKRAVLEKQGYDILNPATDILPMKKDGTEVPLEGCLRWDYFLRGDIIAIMNKCDSMYMTKGWLASKGARLELYVAKKFGFKIEYERNFFIEVICSSIIWFRQKVLNHILKKPF